MRLSSCYANFASQTNIVERLAKIKFPNFTRISRNSLSLVSIFTWDAKNHFAFLRENCYETFERDSRSFFFGGYSINCLSSKTIIPRYEFVIRFEIRRLFAATREQQISFRGGKESTAKREGRKGTKRLALYAIPFPSLDFSRRSRASCVERDRAVPSFSTPRVELYSNGSRGHLPGPDRFEFVSEMEVKLYIFKSSSFSPFLEFEEDI